MKKAVLFIVALILLSIITNAQKTTGGKCFDETTRLLNVGVGFGSTYYGFARQSGWVYRNSPAISISYEQPWSKRVGPGYLGVGGYLGFQGSRWRYENVRYNNGNGEKQYYYQHSYRNFMLAGRMVYHYDGLNFENAEVYGGILLGLRIRSYSYSSNIDDPYYDTYRSNSSASVAPIISPFAAARWYFVPKVAVFGEVGWGVSYLTLGLTFKV